MSKNKSLLERSILSNGIDYAFRTRNVEELNKLLNQGAEAYFILTTSINKIKFNKDDHIFFNKVIFNLINHGLKTEQELGYNLLSIAVATENKDLIMYLLDKKLNPNFKEFRQPSYSAFENFVTNYSYFDQDIMNKFIEAGANFKQTANFDALKMAYYKNNYAMVEFLLKMGLSANLPGQCNYDSKRVSSDKCLVEVAFNTEQYDIFAMFIENNPKSHNYLMENVIVYAKHLKYIELLLKNNHKLSAIIEDKIISLAYSNLEFLKIVMDYASLRQAFSKDLLKIDYFILSERNPEFLKLILEHNINFSKSAVEKILSDEHFNQIVKNYLLLSDLTNQIFAKQNLSAGSIQQLNNLLNDKDCAEIFIGKIKQQIIDNGYFSCDGVDALSTDSEISLSLKYINSKIGGALPEHIKNELTNFFANLEKESAENFQTLEDILIMHQDPDFPKTSYKILLANPVFTKIIESMEEQKFTEGDASLLAYLTSDNFKLVKGNESVPDKLVNNSDETLQASINELNYIKFCHEHVLGKAPGHYLYKFLNNEGAIDTLAYLMQNVPILINIVNKLADLAGMNPVYINIKKVLDYYYISPNFSNFGVEAQNKSVDADLSATVAYHDEYEQGVEQLGGNGNSENLD